VAAPGKHQRCRDENEGFVARQLLDYVKSAGTLKFPRHSADKRAYGSREAFRRPHALRGHVGSSLERPFR
jgi:hypothetical protein